MLMCIIFSYSVVGHDPELSRVSCDFVILHSLQLLLDYQGFLGSDVDSV